MWPASRGLFCWLAWSPDSGPPLGVPMYLLVFLSLASGAWIVTRTPPPVSDLKVWVRNDAHTRIMQSPEPTSGLSLLEQYRLSTGRSVEVEMISGRALDVRLLSLLMSGSSGPATPDLVTIEISQLGKYFRAPLDQVGLVSLNEYLSNSGWDEKLLKPRLLAYSKQGEVFGIPFDVHPVGLTYRKDLFDQAGIDFASAATWSELRHRCAEFQAYWAAHGVANRSAIELPSASADYLVVMLLQRGINLLDGEDRLHLTNPKVAETVAFYARCVARGPGRIAANSTPGPGLFVRDLEQGQICAFITPDWRIDQIRMYEHDLDGKLALMPLPRFETGDARTATWGGTMIGIPKICKDPAESWRLLEHLYLSGPAIEARQRQTRILPAVKTHWSDAAYQQPDPLFGGQKADALLVELAAELPVRYVTPFTAMATAQLSAVLNVAVTHLEETGGRDDDLEPLCRQWLEEAQRQLARRIEFGRFEQ